MVALALVCLESVGADALPVCSYGQAGCPLPLLADLFDRVIQQSSRMHGISSDLHSEYVRFSSSPGLFRQRLFSSPVTFHSACACFSPQERYFLPGRNSVGKRKCHSYGILTPGDKENAQKLGVRGQVLNPKRLARVIHDQSLHFVFR